LSDSLKPLANVKTQLGATLKHLSDVPNIMGKLEDLNFDEFAIKIRGLADSLEPLGNIQSKLGSTLNQLSRLSQVAQQLDEILGNVSENWFQKTFGKIFTWFKIESSSS